MSNLTKLSINTKDPVAVQKALSAIYGGQDIKWRDCRRKSYSIYACKFPEGYVYANKLEQPESYNAIIKQYNKPIVPISLVNKTSGAVDFLKQNGCYITSKEKITLCGTQGEMWEVKLEKLVSSYRLADNSAIVPNNIQTGKWFVVNRVGQDATNEVGIQIPSNFFVQLQLSWGNVYLNNPHSKGHCKGDILVYPKASNGGPDFTKSCSPINNAVFALTFDQNIGGWGRSGCIMPIESAQNASPRIEALNRISESISDNNKNFSAFRLYRALCIFKKEKVRDSNYIKQMDNKNFVMEDTYDYECNRDYYPEVIKMTYNADSDSLDIHYEDIFGGYAEFKNVRSLDDISTKYTATNYLSEYGNVPTVAAVFFIVPDIREQIMKRLGV